MTEVGLLCIGDQTEGLAAVRGLLAPARLREVALETVPDEAALIRRWLRQWSDTQGLALVLTIGGIGLGSRERVPEATAELLERPLPGLAELMRLAGLQKTRAAALSRGLAGVRGKTLILNLPATDTGVALEAALPVIPAALAAIR